MHWHHHFLLLMLAPRLLPLCRFRLGQAQEEPQLSRRWQGQMQGGTPHLRQAERFSKVDNTDHSSYCNQYKMAVEEGGQANKEQVSDIASRHLMNTIGLQ